MIATWMAYTTLITACAAIAAAALEPLARSRGIASRWVWVSALVASCVIPVAMAVRPTWNRSSVSLTSNWVRAAPLSGNESVAYASLTPDGILAVVWVAASGLMLLLVLSGVLQLRRSRARAERASVAGESVAVTADVGPGAVWFGEPRIVLPRWACSLGDDQTSLLVRHEREHVRAGDPSLLASALGLLVLAPWNLPLWFISRRMRAAIEIDCDARVLAEGGDVRRYGELLLTVAARRRGRSSNVRPLDALLPFAEPASPLERRIRAMTDRRPKLSLMRRLTISAIVCVAVVAACEARRPEPLAPVTTFSVHNAKSNQRTELTQTQKDSLARTLSAEIATRVPDSSLVGDPNDPLLIVYSSTGRLLLAKRLSKNEGGASDIPINSNAIATVDVAKGEAVEKRPETKGGVIRIVFKPGAENAGDTWKGSTGKMRVGMDASANPENSRTASGKPSLDSATVYVYDSFGKEIVRQKGSSAAATLVDADQIARMDVQKDGPNDTAPAIRIYLKPGATFKKQ